MKILQIVSCRGWSSDAYWAVRTSRELERRGHEVTLAGRRGAEERVLGPARGEGVSRIEVFALASGLTPGADLADVRRLLAWLPRVDVVHVHRGKEHWLAAAANRLASRPRPIVRTRHIAHAVRPHAANRWLYGRATALVVTVTEAIRQQYLAAGLLTPDRVVTLHGGADADAWSARGPDADVRRRLGGADGTTLVGLVGGLRPMKGHRIVVSAAARLARAGIDAHFALVGRGSAETSVREAIRAAGLEGCFTIAGFAQDLPGAMAAIDVGLYVPLESDGMSRVVFEYLAAARPLIASRVGAVPETLMDGEHALLVPAGDPEALAAAMTRLVRDPALRERLGAAGRRLFDERYSGARVAAALESHYARLLGAA